jgi:multiple sugar transport system permease protein
MSATQVQPRPATQAIGWRRSKRGQELATRWAVRVVLILVGITFMLPFYWMISTSLKPDAQLAVFPPIWVPHPLMWSNYVDAVTLIPFVLYLKNTLIICTAVVAGVVLSSSLCAYGFARISWPGRNVLFLLMLATLMLPYQVTALPLYVVFVKVFHWVPGLKPLIVPSFFGDAFSIFLLRQFFRSIPDELADAARVDGANDWQIMTRVIVPLAKPAIAAVALFNFLYAWNDFFAPLLYVGEDNKSWTLAIGLSEFKALHHVQWNLTMAASLEFMIPVVILFFLMQRVFIEGITVTGVKG